jgi:predicted RNA-binding protein associated with RNAse of E/G family
MDVNALPTIRETKRTLSGGQTTFPCRVLDRGQDGLTVLFVSDRSYRVADLGLPAGTITFGHFWTGRPYNVYHWLTPAGATVAFYLSLADQMVQAGDDFGYRDLTLDVLVRPDAGPEVLDEHELPSPIDPQTRAHIDRALATALADVPTLLPQLEQQADALWLRLTGAERR